MIIYLIECNEREREKERKRERERKERIIFRIISRDFLAIYDVLKYRNSKQF